MTSGFFANFSSIHSIVDSTRSRVHPADDAEREAVLRALGVARFHAEVLGRLDGEAGHRHLVNGEPVERPVGQRVRCVARLLEVALLEGVAVDDERAAARARRRSWRAAPPGSSPRARTGSRPASGCRGREMLTWNADTPASVPAGARISAGKSGSVDRSLPNNADALVNRSPVSCMPSPESPAKRMTTWSSSVKSLDAVSVIFC